MIDESLESALRDFGLTSGEAKVYLSLLSIGESKVGPIIKHSKTSRSKVYDILERLKQKGIIRRVEVNGVASFQALPPKTLLKLIEEKEKELNKKRELLKKSLPKLDSLHPKKGVDIMVFEGFNGFQTMIDQTIKNLKKKDTFDVMGVSQTTEGMRYYAKKIYDSQKKKGFKARSIFDEKGKHKAKERKSSLHKIKILPKGWETPALFAVYQDNVGIYMGDEEEIVSISIKNPKIAKSFKANFEAMWKVSKSA